MLCLEGRWVPPETRLFVGDATGYNARDVSGCKGHA